MTTHTETTEPNKKEGPSSNGIPSSTGSALDDLKEAALEDPFFAFISRWGNVITVLCIVAGLTMLYLQQSEKAMNEAMQDSARVLREGRMTFDRYQLLLDNRRVLKQKIDGTYKTTEGESIPAPEELTKELEKVDAEIAESETLLAGKFDVLSQSRGGYGAMGKAYGVLIKVRAGQIEEAQQMLATLGWTKQKVGSSDRMYSELAALSVARALLDSPDTRAGGKEQLAILAREGTVANVPAALAIANIAEGDDERSAARELLKGILMKHPEQAELVEPEIEALN